MKARYRFLLDHSLDMALSAIEIYNKPDFKGREQVFAVLLTTAWEALFKARIVQQSGGKLTSLYVRDGRRYKRNRSGAYLTIGIDDAMVRCSLSSVVQKNVRCLVDIRDAAIHLTAESKALPYLLFTLGTASLQNYARLGRSWFSVGLAEYNFYILPLGFALPFQTLSAVDFKYEPDAIAAVVAAVHTAQAENRDVDGHYHLVCEIKTELVSAKKVVDEPGIVTSVSAEGAPTLVVRHDVNILDQYPFTYFQVWERLRQELPEVKQRQFNDLIRAHGIKGDSRFSSYNFRSKLEEKRGPSKTTAVVYNADFIRFAVEELRSNASPVRP